MKVLIAVDGSECSLKGVDFILRRRWHEEDEFRVVTVMEAIPVEFGLGHLPEAEMSYDKEMKKECESIAESAKTKLIKNLKGQMIDTKIYNGYVAEEIVKAAQDFNADLIVIGSHGRTGFKRFILGSVAEEVLKKAPCTVEIVRDKIKPEDERKYEKELIQTGEKNIKRGS